MCDNDQKEMVIHLTKDIIDPSQNLERRMSDTRGDNLVARVTPRDEELLLKCEKEHVCESDARQYTGFLTAAPIHYATAPEQEPLYTAFKPIGLSYSLKKSVEDSKYLTVKEPGMHVENPYFLHG